MEKIKCNKCGAIDDYYTELKSNNNVARCNQCDAFIKNIPYDARCLFHFGKYKGEAVADVKDLQYLKWVLGKTKQSARMRSELQTEIDKLEHLAK